VAVRLLHLKQIYATVMNSRHRLRGIPSRLSESFDESVDSVRQPHHYFGKEYLPSPHHVVNSSSNLDSEVQSNNDTITSANQITDVAYLSTVSSSQETLSPQLQYKDLVITPSEIKQAQKSKTKKGGMKSLTPTLTPTRSPMVNTNTPTSFQIVEKAPDHQTVSFSPVAVTIAAIPNASKDFEKETATETPSILQKSSSKEERSSVYILTASAILFIAIFAFAMIRRTKKRHHLVKLNRTDPALCGDASISSEHSSTFQCEHESVHNDRPTTSTSKVLTSFTEVPAQPISHTRKCKTQDDIVLQIKQLFSGNLRSTKRKQLFAKARRRTNPNEYFPPSSPYLVDEYTCSNLCKSNRQRNVEVKCASLPLVDQPLHHIDTKPTSSIPISPGYHESTGLKMVDESEIIAQSVATLDQYFTDKSGHCHVLESDDCSKQPLPHNSHFRDVSITNQKSIDDESFGSIEFINPEIVKQFKVVDQRLSEGFEQFKAVDQKLTIEFDKLEASLVRKHSISNVRTAGDCPDDHFGVLLDRADGESNPEPQEPKSPEQLLYHNNPIISDHQDDSDDYSSNDEDERRYQFHQIQKHFASSWYQKPLEQRSTEASLVNAIQNGDQMNHNFITSSPPKSLLLPKNSSIGDQLSTGNSSTEEEEDILSLSKEEFNFQDIRNRFNR
jgi:hypothetical protein